jgi:hypothetical protein
MNENLPERISKPSQIFSCYRILYLRWDVVDNVKQRERFSKKLRNLADSAGAGLAKGALWLAGTALDVGGPGIEAFGMISESCPTLVAGREGT